jgi:AraC family transcriptional regulator
MIPRIETINEKKLVGKSLRMSLTNNRTAELWRGFMPHRTQVKAISTDLFSLQVYDTPDYFKNFNPGTEFVKWALAEVADFNDVPEGMAAFTFPGGLYAVFTHIGPASAGAKTFQYIFTQWLPNSGYGLDNRPHFEILGAKYKNNEPDSEEEIWVPVKRKG